MKIVFATQNKGKLREAAEILGEGEELLTPQECGIEGEAEETGSTFKENSYLKAKYIADRIFGCVHDSSIDKGISQAKRGNALSDEVMAVFADDSGLEVDALGGEPGIYTARYAGNDKNFADNMDKLLSRLKEVGAESPSERSARFRCAVTVIFRNGEVLREEGALEGRIAQGKAGCRGFGYDPVFIPSDEELSSLYGKNCIGEKEIESFKGKTLAEIPETVKNMISHRFKALQGIGDRF